MVCTSFDLPLPSGFTNEQNLSKTNQVMSLIVEGGTKELECIPFKSDEDLEKDQATTARNCFNEFFQKKGTLVSIPDLSTATNQRIKLNVGDAIYPVCTGGWCRSQALWALLQPYSNQIVLFPPHAARVGWDPYNGQINRHRNYANEIIHDEFSAFFGLEKALRFGFENNSAWKTAETSPTNQNLRAIAQYYDQYYFGPKGSWNGKQGKKRVYIVFSKNAHVVLYRLNQNNDSLEGVTVIAIDSEDIISHPPAFLNTEPRSVKAYEHFSNLLKQVFDLTELKP